MTQNLSQNVQFAVTDISDDMLNRAREKLDKQERVHIQQADACELPFSDEQYDTYLSMFGLMFFEDKLRAMKEAHRV